jgi:hypothetical protein
MPTASVKPYISDPRKRTRLRFDLWVPAAVLAAFVAIALLAPRIQPGPFVGRVTIVNNSAYAFNVDVSEATAGDWMLLGTAAQDGTTSVAAVFDQGSTWTFRFAAQGKVVGEVALTRSDLVASGWQVVVPDGFARLLQRQGVVPSA